ncbi:hypothetical protein DY000_02017147 [Brassica cretica]|uniref:pyruvate decarboxylase n=1 Tax=Brassica cretica TaxID=69181 RepID=A0ABQ7CWF6_BRACR|nr:hypothetical protein DY000_02017147 [Brassica cretica]
MDTVIGSIDACNPATGDICRPPNGAVSTVQNSNPAHSTTISPCDATLGRYLARRLVEIGVTDVFSVPGDFNLTLLDHLIAEPSLKLIGCCNELNAGYAADGYARSRGVGACVVTFTDVSTMIRCGQKTIIFLINNGGYTIEVEIHDGPYNVIKNWNYTAFVEAIHNGEGKCWTAKVRCEDELVKAISTAMNEEKESFCFIEVIVHKDDTSKELLEWGSRVSAANSRPPNPQ